jgi:hypothetical protein
VGEPAVRNRTDDCIRIGTIDECSFVMMTTSAATLGAVLRATPRTREGIATRDEEAGMRDRTRDTTASGRASGIKAHEVAAYVETARRGDVLPTCMRLETARVASAWADRATIALAVGPACPFHVLDTACTFMPRAAEPRLLRAAASIVAARIAKIAAERAAWITRASRDLDDAARIDPGDATVLVLRGELADAAVGG